MNMLFSNKLSTNYTAISSVASKRS